MATNPKYSRLRYSDEYSESYGHPPEELQDNKESIGEIEETSSSFKLEQQRKALFRSILILLGTGILSITFGVLLTKFTKAYRNGDKFGSVFQSPSEETDTGPGWISDTKSSKRRDFMRDQSEFILSPPKWEEAARMEPKTKEYHWKITDITANPDGVMKPMVVINGQFPGPLIECNEGDTIKVTIYNHGTNATAFHWHGMLQNGTNWMDGTPGVTQCPIPPGGEFTYEFNTTGQYGTYWYHSHFGTQYVDGLFGPLVIHSQKEPGRERYTTDQVVMLHDQYHDLSRNKLYEYLAPDNENDEPIPDGALINGRNV